MAVGALLVAVALWAGGRGGDPVVPEASAPATTAPVGPGGIGDGWGPEVLGRTPLAGFGEVQATITDETGETCEVCLLSATSDQQRARGLMEVTEQELGGYDGMLFEYPEANAGGFWMRNTPLPLSIAFFDGDGALVSTTDMEPCEDSPACPSYAADAPFRFALEVPQGQLEDVGVVGTATIRIDGRRCTTPRGEG